MPSFIVLAEGHANRPLPSVTSDAPAPGPSQDQPAFPKLLPEVEILLLPSDVDQPVDRG